MAINSNLTGYIIVPGDPEYPCARRVFNTLFSEYPQVIVYCHSACDVANALHWARACNVPFRIRCGGHSYEGFSVLNGGLVIDISCLTAISIDPCNQTVQLGAGHTLLALYTKLARLGVSIPGGTCPGVGISGLTLGGGFGMHTRLWGMTCDNLTALEMIDAEGRLIYADENTNADLFWASRGGGGGNFGIVTSFTFRLHPVSYVSIFEITWDWQNIGEVINTWQHWAPFTDNRLTSTLKILTREKGTLTAAGEFLGPEAELRQLLQPLLTTGKPVSTEITTVPFIIAAYRWAGFPGDPDRWPRAPVPFKNTGSFAYDSLPASAIDVIVNNLSTSPTQENWLTLQALGGAAARLSPSATAYPHRQAQFALLYDSFPQHYYQVQENIDWVEGFRTAMLAYTRGAYVNFPDCAIQDWPCAYYGENLMRLMQVKERYDPHNVFQFPQSIPLLNKAFPG